MPAQFHVRTMQCWFGKKPAGSDSIIKALGTFHHVSLLSCVVCKICVRMDTLCIANQIHLQVQIK